MDAGTIQAALIGHLRMGTTSLVMGNVWVKGSPWESDVIAVTSAYYWHEYEIKVTRTDYRRDFEKNKKHESYASEDAIELDRFLIPKPKSFTFVVPKGLLEGIDVPSHCGVIEVYETKYDGYELGDERPAPNLRKPTKLSHAQIFNLAQKAASRVLYQARSD